jgi:hypothetical protein
MAHLPDLAAEERVARCMAALAQFDRLAALLRSLPWDISERLDASDCIAFVGSVSRGFVAKYDSWRSNLKTAAGK